MALLALVAPKGTGERSGRNLVRGWARGRGRAEVRALIGGGRGGTSIARSADVEPGGPEPGLNNTAPAVERPAAPGVVHVETSVVEGPRVRV